MFLGRNFPIEKEERSRIQSTQEKPQKSKLLSTQDTTQILIQQCEQRKLSLNKTLRHKPWRMALMIHRHDTGQPCRDHEFRHGIQSPGVHESIHSHAHPTHPPQAILLQQKQQLFTRELMDALKSRRVLVHRQAVGAMEPHQVLSLLPRLLAKALREGKGKYDPPHEPKTHKDKRNNKEKLLPRVRAPWATPKPKRSLTAVPNNESKKTHPRKKTQSVGLK
jgi:hypothetical protein